MVSSVFTYLPEHSSFCLVECRNVLKTELWRVQSQIILIKGNGGSRMRDELRWTGSYSVPRDSERKDQKKPHKTTKAETKIKQVKKN